MKETQEYTKKKKVHKKIIQTRKNKHHSSIMRATKIKKEKPLPLMPKTRRNMNLMRDCAHHSKFSKVSIILNKHNYQSSRTKIKALL